MAINQQLAFAPLGLTVAITANNPAPTGVLIPLAPPNATATGGQFRVVNASNATVHLGFGSTAALASTNAAEATSGNPAKGLPLLSGAVEIIRVAPGLFFSAFAAGASTIYITPGEGL